MSVSPEFKKILIAILIIAAIGGIIASAVAVTRSILSKASELPGETITPAPKLPPPKTPAPKTTTPSANLKPQDPPPATPPATPQPPPSSPSAPLTPTIENGWTAYGTGPVNAILSFSPDYQNLYADFVSNSSAIIHSLDYSLTYEDIANNVRLIKGSVSPTGGIFNRKVIPLGTCSGNTCVYDTGPRNFVFRLLTKTNNGLTTYLKTYSLASLPATLPPITLP